MKKILPIAALAAAMVAGSGVRADEFPSFALMGFPITPVQVQVVGAAHVEERSPIATLTEGGMPASPHQVSVLTPRSGIAAQARAARLAKTGSLAPGAANQNDVE